MEILSRYHASYQEFKQALDAEMHKAVEGFVKIGFLLNFAAETNILEEGGYANVNDFAKAEYNIDPTQVSRFVNIYKRFGVEGEPRLKEQYSNHGVAKLGIMLTLPDYINEEITENYSKSEITAIKREVEAEAKISDIEVEIEKAEMKESVQYTLPEGLKQAVFQLIHDYQETYVRSYLSIELDDFKEALAPMGEDTYFVRIKGIGKLAIFVRAEADITITNLRQGTKESYEWQQLFDSFKEYFAMGTDAKDSWCNVFQESWPLEEKKVEEKPVENTAKPHKDNVGEAKLAPKKESRVKVPEPKKETPKLAPKAQEEPPKEPEEQLPGQDSILNHPELLPDDMKEDEQEVLTGEVEDIENLANTDKYNVQQASENMKVEHFAPVQESNKEMILSCKQDLENMIGELREHLHDETWDKMSYVATSIVWKVKTLKKLLEEAN